MHALRLL